MNNDETYTPCTKCGRPLSYCKGQCCGKPKGCQCKEYGPKVCGAIRPGEPKCPYQAVIPSLTVESVSNLKDLADCFVHVSDINTTFYIDDKHRIMTTWAGLVSVEDYDFEANPLNLRGQIAYDAKNNKAAIYDKQGVNYIFQISDINNDYMLLEDKPQINGVTLEGDKTGDDLGLQDKLMPGSGISIDGNEISIADADSVVYKDTYATPDSGGAVKVGETLTINNDGVLNEAPFLNYLPIETHVTRYQGAGGYSTVYYAIIDAEYKPDLTLANDTINTVQLSGDNALDNKSTLTVNAGLFSTSNATTVGVVIKDGEILRENDSPGTYSREILYMTEDGTLHSVPTSSYSASQVLALGAVWAVQGWYPFVKDGEDLTSRRDPADYGPRSLVAQDVNGNYLVFSVMGREYDEAGFNAADCVSFCTSIGFTPYFLYNLDGGASVNFVDRGIRLNGLIDDENRKVANFITWASNSAKNNGTFNVANATYHKNVQEMRQSIPMNITSQVSANGTNVTLDSASRLFLFGDLVVGWLKFTTTEQINAYGTILNGLPGLPYAVSDIGVQFHKKSGAHDLINLYIANGALHVSGENNMAAGTWFGSIIYSHNSGRSQSSNIE